MNDLFDDPLFRDVKRFFQLVGCWPYQERRVRVTILLIIFFGVGSMHFPLVWHIVEEFHNIKEIVICLPELFVSWSSIFSFFNATFNSGILKKVFEDMNNNFKNATDPEEKSILIEFAKLSCLLVRLFICASILTISIFCMLPLLSMALNELFPEIDPQPVDNILKVQYYHVDPQKNYWIIYFHGLYATYTIIFGLIIYNVFLVMATLHICSIYAVLRYKLGKIGSMNDEMQTETSTQRLDQVLLAAFKECILYHQNIIRLLNSVEETVTYLMFAQVFFNMLLITIMGVITITSSNKPIHLISYALNTTSATVILFSITWCGQQIFNYSSQLSYDIYNIPWYEFPPKSKKLLLIMLMRSSEPYKLTAAGVIDLNLESFCNFIKTSVSYFAMVLSTQEQ